MLSLACISMGSPRASEQRTASSASVVLPIPESPARADSRRPPILKGTPHTHFAQTIAQAST